jgi:TolB-like protein/Flp pilus assembly protein TadD
VVEPAEAPATRLGATVAGALALPTATTTAPPPARAAGAGDGAPDGGREAANAVATIAAPRGGRPLARRTIAAIVVVAVALAGAGTWAVMRRTADSTPASAATDAPGVVGTLSVVVLPFMDLSGGGARQAYFADGLTDELTATLSRLDGVRVLARTSAFSLRNRAVDVRQIGRTFAVSHVVEGTVRRTAARLRVTARLVDARTGYQLWAETFDRAEGDVFRIEDDLAASIVRALSEHLGPGALPALPAPPARTPVALPAYEDYLRGRYALHQRTGPAIEEARRLFTAVIQRDPAYAPAYAGLAMAAHLAPIYGYVSYAAGYDDAVRAAERAIALDSTLAEPWATLGLVRQRRYDWLGAIAAYREALRRDPNSATAHQWYGKALTQLGRYPEAEAEVRRALVLDPTSAVIRYNLGQLHFAARRYDEAAAALQAALAVAPSFRFAHSTLGLVRVAQGRHADAIDEFAAAAADPSHTPDETAVLAYGYAMAGQRARARTLLAEARRARAADGRVSPADLAIAHMALGEPDSAFVWLDRAFEEHDSDLAAFATCPVLDPLRGDPRFAALRARMRLSPEPAAPPTTTAAR